MEKKRVNGPETGNIPYRLPVGIRVALLSLSLCIIAQISIVLCYLVQGCGEFDLHEGQISPGV